MKEFKGISEEFFEMYKKGQYLQIYKLIEDGVDGVLFKPFDEKDLADKIVNLHEHPQNLKQMAKNARVHAQQKFTWENTWAKVMNEIVQKSCK